jgi:hypothetical protein
MLAVRGPCAVRYVMFTSTARTLPAAGTVQDSVNPFAVTGPPLAKPPAAQRGDVEDAVSLSASMRREAACATRVSTFPRPIIRVTMAVEPAMAMIPIDITMIATSTSTRVNPESERFTW